MKALVHITIWLWSTVMVVPALVCPSVIEETKALRYNTLTFNFEGATTDRYKEFVKSLRNEVKSKEVFGLPVTAKTPSAPKKYVLVQLKIDSQKFITLAISASNLYVVGYLDNYQGNDRANFVSDAPQDAKDDLFKGAKVRKFKFTGNYKDLVRVAGAPRENIQLGINKLQKAISLVYGTSNEGSDEAKFFIISIQMVSEAARFEYILGKVLEGGVYGSYKPGPKARKLENQWDKISKAIQTATKSTGEFLSPIILDDENGKSWTVTKVSDIERDMGLLKFLETSAGQASQFSQLTQLEYI